MLFSADLSGTDLYVGDPHALARVDCYKYLGLNFSTTFRGPTMYVGLVCKKTRKLIGLLYGMNFYRFFFFFFFLA